MLTMVNRNGSPYLVTADKNRRSRPSISAHVLEIKGLRREASIPAKTYSTIGNPRPAATVMLRTMSLRSGMNIISTSRIYPMIYHAQQVF